MSAKPILFVDIDGVLNPFGGPCPENFEEHNLFPQDDEPIRVSQIHALWLAELAEQFELAWGTGWPSSDRDVLMEVLQLPTFIAAATMPPVPFDPAQKILGISELAGNRPAAWIDDVMTAEAIAWADSRSAPTLLVETQSHLGMDRGHVDKLLDWVRSISK